jgi:hypothetical protein
MQRMDAKAGNLDVTKEGETLEQQGVSTEYADSQVDEVGERLGRG